MKNKIFSVLFLAGIMMFGIYTNSYAQTDEYLVKDNSQGVVYSFNKNELIDSFLKVKGGEESALYREYIKVFSKNGLYAFHDDTKKYISYEEVEKEFLNCKASKIGFNLDNYTEKVGKAMNDMPKKIKKVTAPDNKIIYTDIDSGSSSSEEIGDLEVISIE
ncbi:hypothetical protein [Clostridium novyi]|uniref:Uncharacterized protein n=1 Tax=Clostridium novyi (strain NT) TaxID=386415 RepID=A0PZ38_CLONN|nr:hypothetical protein [Clostridium novyi]ABK62142.1 hypothetical protein NT01CX_1559 [Clostridium novyi NT]KEH86002.1 hypothetical protein Z966_04720 [Clostridium novyi A str. NCTC 538]KEH87351.1 hypothetical protein Z967_03505 [Clostridium novyi A str. 4540]KEH94027.1 hypothetical protein Z964_01785 [Clostridium novyi A str. GD211209]